MLRRTLLTALLLALAACASTPTFDVAKLQPTPDAAQTMLTGRFELNGLQFRLYSGAGDACISGALTSLAGIPPPEYSNRQMTLSGRLITAGREEAGSLADPGGSGLILIANEVTVPDAASNLDRAAA